VSIGGKELLKQEYLRWTHRIVLENRPKDDKIDAAYSKKNQVNTRESSGGKFLRGKHRRVGE
jgi:hypothetical protein